MNLPFEGVWIKTSILTLFLLLTNCLTVMAQDDYITVRSGKTKIEKIQATVLWEVDVEVVQKSTGSTLTADKLFIKRDNQTNKPIQAKADGNVHSIIYQFDIEHQTTRKVDITCKAAEVDRLIDKALLRGTVTVKSHDFNLTADAIRYDMKNETGTITEIPGKQVLMQLIKNATVLENSSTNPQFVPNIVDGAADEIRINRPSRKITLQGKVKLIDHSEQTSFTANRADVFFDYSEKLNRIIAYQNVIISQPKRKSTADRAVFDYPSETVILTGHASVKELDQLEINSSSITMYMNENKGIIRGEKAVPVKGKMKISP